MADIDKQVSCSFILCVHDLGCIAVRSCTRVRDPRTRGLRLRRIDSGPL